MKVEPFAPSSTFEEFCDRHGIELYARERSKRYSRNLDLAPWYVSGNPRVEIRERGLLTCTHGNGDTPEEALRDYARKLCGHWLLIDSRREVVAPNEWSDGTTGASGASEEVGLP